MKKPVLVGLFFVCSIAFSQAFDPITAKVNNTDPDKLFVVSSTLLARWQTAMSSVKSAAQSSQVSEETNVQMNYIIIKQNEEIIRLLKKVAGETK
jgi:hypothetical protein